MTRVHLVIAAQPKRVRSQIASNGKLSRRLRTEQVHSYFWATIGNNKFKKKKKIITRMHP